MLIILDETPISKNKYVNMHWSKRKEYKESISWLMYEAKKFGESQEPEEYKGLPYKKATLKFDIYFKTHRRRDVQNYVGGGLISWIDCLVDLGFIKDDCWDCIGQPLIFFTYDNDFPRTEISIKEVAYESRREEHK